MGERNLIEPELFEHGIQTENADIRAHVSPISKRVYIFQYSEWPAIELECIRMKLPTKRGRAKGAGHTTYNGWAVPIDWFKDLRVLNLSKWPIWEGFTPLLSEDEKGDRAVRIVIETMRRARFPIWMKTREDDRKNIQIKGTDIVLFCRKLVQVKCDCLAGPKDIQGCSGNLFLQTYELRKRY